MSELESFLCVCVCGGGNPDNVQDTPTRTMSELEKFFPGGVCVCVCVCNPDNVQDTLTWTMSELEIVFLWGGG